MKLAVFFPGIGYHCDKPLLYYSEKIAKQYQYETIKIVYEGLSKDLDAAFEEAFAQTEKRLAEVDWQQYEDILFVSKSIGTAVACAYAGRYQIDCRNLYYTPLEQTFILAPKDGIVFHGTSDPWAQTEVIQRTCREHNLPLQIIEAANHSLEIPEKTRQNLVILTEVMEESECYIADTIRYRQLTQKEICLELFAWFIRRQNVTKCRRKVKDAWVIVEDPFVDDWTAADYQTLAGCLKNTVNTGGFVCGAFYRGMLKGFVSVEASLFGGENRYLDLSSIHVSEDMRGQGAGRELFAKAAAWAAQKGAAKLYISAHSAVETQAFYQAMGCVEAQMYEASHVEREPFDCQLEYILVREK